MASLSVVISAFNEEAKIRDCLKSVRSMASETVFVDGSSTDKTSQIAKEFKVRLYKRPNNPTMLNINKNFGIDKATKDWILYLDADERVTDELKKELLATIKRHTKSKLNGFWIPRKNIIFGKWIEYCGMYPDYQLRLFRRGKGKFPAVHVHEMIDVNGPTGHLKHDLFHLNFESISQFLYKHIELYASNEMETLHKQGYKFSYLDAIRFPAKEFLSRFFAREGYRDGLHGLMLSLLFAFYHLVIFAKIWEKEGFHEHTSTRFLDTTSKEFKQFFEEMQYWVANEKLKRSKSILEQALLRVQRKMKS